VTAGEDRSRVRTPTAVLNLAMIRRATISLAAYWIQRCRMSPAARTGCKSGGQEWIGGVSVDGMKKAGGFVHRPGGRDKSGG